jgi:hypothetical protein
MKFGLTLLPWMLILVCGAAPWHHDLWLGQGGVWESRVTIKVVNQSDAVHEGAVIAIRVGSAPGEAPLAGADIKSLRVVNSENRQLLFNLWQHDLSDVIAQGALPEGALLTLPLVCGAGETTSFTLYFDNRSAWGLADFLPGRPETPLNGDFENGGGLPLGWHENPVKPAHALSLSDESPFSGSRCVRQVAAPGMEASWSGIYRDGIRVVPGASCTLRVRIRTRDLKGTAGWFIHAGNRDNGQLLNRHASVGTITPQWHELVIHFTVPDGATTLRTGSFLRGSGTAWFDDLRIESDMPLNTMPQLSVTCSEVERLDLKRAAGTDEWIAPPPGIARWSLRFPVTILPSAGRQAGEELLAAVNADSVMRGIAAPRFRLMLSGEEMPLFRLAENLLFRVKNTPGLLRSGYLYVADSGGEPSARELSGSVAGSDIPSDQMAVFRDNAVDPQEWLALMTSDMNLIRNPSFEAGDATPDDWGFSGSSASSPAVRFAKREGALFGAHCAECVIGPAAKPNWYGWRQALPVNPGSTYLFGGWMATADFTASGHLHAHITPKKGTDAKTVFLSAGRPISGTTGWTPMFGTATIPHDYDTFSLHLTANCAGTMRHDGFIVAECIPAAVGEAQSPPQSAELVAWQANPIVKLFRESLPPLQPQRLRLHMARNESEPLQLALRAGRQYGALRIEVPPPKLESGTAVSRFFRSLLRPGRKTESAAALTDITVGRVDYVPIDAKSGYSNWTTPEWEFKFPQQSHGSDGWPGWWPDPIVESAHFALEANRTQPMWITFNTDAQTAPGDYRGELHVMEGERAILKIPYTITVWDFTIPLRPDFPAIYDVRFKNTSFSNWSDRRAAREKILRFMAEKKLSPDTVQGDIPLALDQNGSVTCDFTEYDEACRLYFEELQFKVSYTPNNFYLFGWGHPPKSFLGEAPYEGEYPYTDADRSRLRPEYKRVYQEALRLYWNHIRERGWAQHFVLYISDEPHFSHESVVTQMQALCAMIHEVDPAIPIYSSTWRHCPQWDSSIDVWGAGHYGCFPVEEMRRQQARGRRIWFTTDGQMCTDTPLLATERMLPHYAFKFGADAYEFWGVSWYTHNPWQFGWHSYIRQSSTPGEHYYVRYPDGDGYLIYPPLPEMGEGREPVTSIRIEAARDGVEDWCYLSRLRELARESGDSAAEALLEEFLSLCEIPNAGGRYAGRNLNNPDKLTALRVRVGKTIERLEKRRNGH